MNCDNCEIEVPCAEDCEQCKRRGENQESQEFAKEPISCYSCQHRNGCTYPESKVGGPCILYLNCIEQGTVKERDEFIKECYELLAKGATDEQWKFATKLRLACKRLEATENRDKKVVELLDTVLLIVSMKKP